MQYNYLVIGVIWGWYPFSGNRTKRKMISPSWLGITKRYLCDNLICLFSFHFVARSPVFSAMFEHEMEESKKVGNRMNMCLSNQMIRVRSFPIWQQTLSGFFLTIIKMEYNSLNRHLLRAESSSLEVFQVKWTHLILSRSST